MPYRELIDTSVLNDRVAFLYRRYMIGALPVRMIPEYTIWRDIIQSCYDEKQDNYHRYGGKGIYVYEQWRLSFWYFLNDVGERPDLDYSLGRIDKLLHYTPDNVRWMSKLELRHSRLSEPDYRGENNAAAKLTWFDVIEIRRRYSRDDVSTRKLAKEFEVSQSSIMRIVNNKGWV